MPTTPTPSCSSQTPPAPPAADQMLGSLHVVRPGEREHAPASKQQLVLASRILDERCLVQVPTDAVEFDCELLSRVRQIDSRNKSVRFANLHLVTRFRQAGVEEKTAARSRSVRAIPVTGMPSITCRSIRPNCVDRCTFTSGRSIHRLSSITISGNVPVNPSISHSTAAARWLATPAAEMAAPRRFERHVR